MESKEKNSYPSTEKWDALRGEFAAAGEYAETPCTLSPEVPLAPYGETPGAAERLARRIMGRLLRWYVQPLIAQQNRINRALREENALLRARVAALEEKHCP